jgi:hypothetical protein
MSATVMAQVTGSAVTSVALYVTSCPTPSCGVIYAITEDYKGRRYKDGESFYCPNGHISSWSDTEEKRLLRRAEWAETRLGWAETSRDAARDQAEAAHHSARAYKGHLTRMRNRIASGICPVQGCRRNFANVKAHVTTQHPQWAHEHPEALA